MEIDDKIYINGIDGATGQYLVKPKDLQQIKELITRQPAPGASEAEGKEGSANGPAQMSWLRHIWHVISKEHAGLPDDIEPSSVQQAGWAVVFHQDEDQAVKDKLARLVEHRRQQIGDDEKVKVLEYRVGEGRAKWLARHGMGAGGVEPTKVPFYLLMVGSPSKIPFTFVHHLDVEYCVGCLHFDAVEEYEKYVESVIAYEQGAARPRAKEVVFFAPRHGFDRATQMSADYLVKPLADGASGAESPGGVASKYGFSRRKLWGADATKGELTGVFSPRGKAPGPAFLFTASHGMGFPAGHPSQATAQGSLVCQDWPSLGSIEPSHYFAADDVPDESNVHGLIAFCFACYGAGTPVHDRFMHSSGQQPSVIARAPFFSPLPKRLLTHPNGGALAWIGHVERAWGYSIMTPGAGAQLLPFENAIGRILDGQPLGYAMKDFGERYAALSTSLCSMLEERDFGCSVPDSELAAAWIERNDAEGYIVFGDPAVQLRTADLVAPAA